VVERSDVPDEDRLLEIVLEAGGEDLKEDGGNMEIFTSPEAFAPVVSAMESAGIQSRSSSVDMIPQNVVRCEPDQARKVLNMLEALEEHEDVQNVWANFDIDDEVFEERG
jgi:transcriptional/translational regulatory protein YebC/TACO1